MPIDASFSFASSLLGYNFMTVSGKHVSDRVKLFARPLLKSGKFSRPPIWLELQAKICSFIYVVVILLTTSVNNYGYSIYVSISLGKIIDSRTTFTQ